MMFRTIALALALLPGVAFAQATTCANTYYGMPQLGVTCETQSARPISSQDIPAKRCNPLDFIALDAVTCQARAVAADRKAVTDLIAAGNCDDAVKAALRLGDLQYAREVREFCASR